jgi:IS5 family transposase
MRRTIREQRSLAPPPRPIAKAREYEEMSRLLEAVPEAAELVLADLVSGGVNADRGRHGMAGEQVLRAKILRQREGFSYANLAFEIAANTTFQAFCRQAPDQCWSKSTLHRNLSAVSATTLERINRLLLGVARHDGIETGERVAVDATAVETDIHRPTDSKLLLDVVRVLTRLTHAAVRVFVTEPFTDRARAAARLNWRISSARRKVQRVPLYRELLDVAQQTIDDARRVAARLLAFADPVFVHAARRLEDTLRVVLALGERVVYQTYRRVVEGKPVPARDKVLSIFEPHTDLIVQGNSITYGHKVTFTTGVSGLVLDAVVEEGNPNDVTKTLVMLQRQAEIYGCPPAEAAFDGAYSSTANLAAAKALGVKDVVFSKHAGIKVEAMVSEPSQFEVLRCFRTGVERAIGFLKGSFGLRRCPWNGRTAFCAYVWSSVLSANLVVLARRRMERELVLT